MSAGMHKRAKKCSYCLLRLRSKNNEMHRKCERAYYDPPIIVVVRLPAVKYPASRFCPECRSLDNGMFPAKICRKCQSDTIEQLPVMAAMTQPAVKKRRRKGQPKA